MSMSDVLRASVWADCLSAAQRERVAAEIIVRDVPAGAFVCRKGEPVEHWIGVVDGLLKISIVSPAGRAMTLTGVAAGGWFGEGSMLKTEARRYDAIALRTTRVACMPRKTFQWLCDTSLPFNRFLITHLNERCGQFIAMLEADRLLDRDARVAQCLSLLFNPHLYPGFGPHIDISQEEIGHLSGLSRQHVNKALHRLELRGLLRVDHRGITITDVSRLGTFSG